MPTEDYYNIGPQASGFDFYVGGIEASSVSFITTDVTASSSAIRFATSISSSQTTVVGASSKIAFASATAGVATTVTIIAAEVLKGLIHLDSVTTVTVTSLKIATASSLSAIQSSTSFNALKIQKAHTDIAIGTTVQGFVIKNVLGSAQIHIIHIVDFTVKEINYANLNILIKTRANINQPIRFSPSFVDYGSIRTFLILDNKPLTNHNRQLDVSLSPSFIENRNWNNRKSRYYKMESNAGRKTFNLSWRFLPNFMDKTVDTRHARDYISSISEDPDVHILKIINQDESGLTPYTEAAYNVFVRSYSETMIRRDLSDGVYYFDCNLTLEEA